MKSEKAAASRPVTKRWCPKESALPSTSTLKVEDYMVSHNEDGWKDDAFRIFRDAGFVVVKDVLSTEQCAEVLQTCQHLEEEIVGPERQGNRALGRYSFGVASSSGAILHLPVIAGHLLNDATSKLLPLLRDIFFEDGQSEFSCYSGGGDFVLPGVNEWQHLHSDLKEGPGAVALPPPFLCINFSVQELTWQNGPMRLVPGKRNCDWDHQREPCEWRNSRLFPCPPGAALVRDVRVLHGGTPNLGAVTRFLPSVEFVSGDFRRTGPEWLFPPSRSIPRVIFEGLSEEVKRVCHELVAEPAVPGAEEENAKPWESIFWQEVKYAKA